MEQGIIDSASILVCVGSDGIGPWEQHEQQAAMRLGVSEGRAVIPLLLPGAPAHPDMPLFLGNHTWVDLRAGLRKAGMDRLQWGITGTPTGDPLATTAADDDE